MENHGRFSSRFLDDEIMQKSYSHIDTQRLAEKELKSMEKSEHGSLHGSKAVFTFVQPTQKLKITYREQQNRLRMSVARHKDLQDGCLLDTLEKGVGYPVIHVNFQPRQKFLNSLPPVQVKGSRRFQRKSESFSAGLSAASSAPQTSELKDLKKRSHAKKELPTVSRLLKEDALGPSVHVQQGLYEEVKRIEPDFAFSPRDNIDSRAFIILGFKTLDTGFSSVLEQTWRDWTGARSIYLKLHNDYDLSKIVFYHRLNPVNELDMFTYIVLVECWNVNASNLIHVLDFVQRMRVERLNGYISLYRDLGLEEGDSNYHSASQESLTNDLDANLRSLRSSVSPYSQTEDEEEEDEGISRSRSGLSRSEGEEVRSAASHPNRLPAQQTSNFSSKEENVQNSNISRVHTEVERSRSNFSRSEFREEEEEEEEEVLVVESNGERMTSSMKMTSKVTTKVTETTSKTPEQKILNMGKNRITLESRIVQ